jgi:hypothetical protein
MLGATMMLTKPTSVKEAIDVLQGLVTIVAVFVGGFWTYDVFIKERRNYPHANIEHKISHLALSDRQNLLLVGLELTNTGSSLLRVRQQIIRIQQILPALECEDNKTCAPTELKEAAGNIQRKQDRFSWPLIAERVVTLSPAAEIEPGEKHVRF